MNIIISVNPKAGRCSSFLRAEELLWRLNAKGFHAELLTDLDEVTVKANRFFAEGRLRVLVGVGGDGTAATLVNRTTQGTPITLLPAGTANLISKHFRLGNTPAKLADIIENGKLTTLDAGKVTFANTALADVIGVNKTVEGVNECERIFLVMLSCGLDADIVNGVHSRREERYRTGHKKGAHISYLSYIKPIFHSMLNYRYNNIKVEQLTDDGKAYVTVDDKAKWAFVFNLNRYGWGLPLAPFARGDDGKLDHVLFRGGSVFCGVIYTLFAQCFSLHRFLPAAKLGQAVKYRITAGAEANIPFQLDGDPAGILPAEIEVIKDRFTLLVGNNSKRT
jgi:diacylglycerol kinase family enzyme